MKATRMKAETRTNAYGIVILSWKYVTKTEAGVLISLRFLLCFYPPHISFFLVCNMSVDITVGIGDMSLFSDMNVQLLHQRNVTSDAPELLL